MYYVGADHWSKDLEDDPLILLLRELFGCAPMTGWFKEVVGTMDIGTGKAMEISWWCCAISIKVSVSKNGNLVSQNVTSLLV